MANRIGRAGLGLWRIAAGALVMAAVAAGALGFTPPQAPSPLTGTWTLVGADRIGRDGVRRKDYGADPRGRLMIDERGRYSCQIFSAERPRFGANDKARGTPEEYQAAVLGASTHLGTVTVDEATGTLRFRIEQSLYRNWEGTEQERRYRLEGDELTYQVPASASGDGSVAISTWRRVR